MTQNIISEEEFLKKLAEKLSTTKEEITIEFETLVTEVGNEEAFKGAPAEKIRIMARNRFGPRKMREISSSAIAWEGAIIGAGDLVDTVARQKAATIAAFKADPMKTTKGCIFNEILVKSTADGVPIYPDTEGNKKFGRAGRPLPEHSWLRTLLFIARPIDPKTKQAGPAQVATMSLNDVFAINVSKIPMMTQIKFKGINKTNTEDQKSGVYRINHSAFTKFEAAAIKDFPPMEDILPSIASHYEQLGALEEWHNKNEQNKVRWVITEGSVTNLSLEPNAKTGNRFMGITDESLMFGGSDKTSVMCWIPADRNIVIDFGQESRVFVVGKTSRGKAKDPITGNYLEGVPGDVSINVYGLYAPEIFKVSQAMPLTEASVVPQAETRTW